MSPAHEEAVPRGLPGALPDGESLLWQGAPDLRATLLRTFHLRGIALYFGLLLAWRFGDVMWDGTPIGAALSGTLPLLGVSVAALAILAALAVGVCRTTLYTITSRRVFLRIGIALPITFNIPFAVIASASLKLSPDGTGTIPLALTDPNRLAYLVLWPHVRPWHTGKAQPALRQIPQAAAVASLLSEAVSRAAPELFQGAAPAVQPGTAAAPWPLAPAAA